MIDKAAMEVLKKDGSLEIVDYLRRNPMLGYVGRIQKNAWNQGSDVIKKRLKEMEDAGIVESHSHTFQANMHGYMMTDITYQLSLDFSVALDMLEEQRQKEEKEGYKQKKLEIFS